MRVLVIEPCHVNFGGYFRSFNICSSLSKRGIFVEMLVSSNKNFQLSIRKTQINENFYQYELPRINTRTLANGRLIRAFIGLLFGIFKRYDVIHVCVPTQLEANIPSFFLKLLGKKIVMDWDDYWIGSPIFEGKDLIQKYNNFCETRAPQFYENMIVVSDFLENLAKKWGAKNTLKLINGVNTSQFKTHTRDEGIEKLKLDKNKKYLLSFGNTYANDRARLLFKAFENIYNIDPSVYLLFNFDPYKIAKEQKLEDKVNVNCFKNIINVGYINQEDLGYYLGACEAAILLQGSSEDEIACFPIRIGSYLNGESVIIMNDVNSEAGNTLKNNSCAIIEKDIRYLAEKTVEFLNNEEIKKALKNNVIKAKQNLSWDNLINELIIFYKKIK